jgi:sulfur carrier protein
MSSIAPIRLMVSGEERMLEASSVNDLLIILRLPPEGRGIAIAINDSVVPKSRWQDHVLNDGDHIEIVRATQGG